ncbi:MAG TPA: hypothetical protein VKV30_01750 [Candidatus Angelobacter sp.]|nr:hypothetical protein [Candidatus Angelobacter sp.]
MEYLVGILLSLGTIVLAAVVGFARERSFYSTVLIVVATYYILFAAMGASGRTLMIEIVIASGFILFAALGFKGNFWLVAAALMGHGIFDFIRPSVIANPGVPHWWPGFCMAFDVIFGGWMALHCCSGEAFRIQGPWIGTPVSFYSKAGRCRTIRLSGWTP